MAPPPTAPPTAPDDAPETPSAPSWITVCDTCKREDWRAGEGETSGERLLALVEAAAAGNGGTGAVRVRRHSCLMGCARACNLAVQAPGKMAYTLGGFAPEREVAEAVVAWARLHAASPSGVVAYRSWPEPIKGHFVTRHPPLPGGG